MKYPFRPIDPFLARPATPGLDDLPPEMREIVQLVAWEKDRTKAARVAYEKLSERFHGSRWFTFLHLDRFLITDIRILWKKRILHCNHLNYLLRTVLMASGRFAPDDVVARWTLIWFVSPHQYLRVRLENGGWLPVDLWSRSYGIPFGSYAHGFRSGTLLR